MCLKHLKTHLGYCSLLENLLCAKENIKRELSLLIGQVQVQTTWKPVAVVCFLPGSLYSKEKM